MSVSGITSGTNVAEAYGALNAVNTASSTASATTDETGADAAPAIEAVSTTTSTSTSTSGSGSAGQLSSDMMGLLLDQQASSTAENAEMSPVIDATTEASPGATDSGSASGSGSVPSGGGSKSSNTVYDSADTNEDGKVSAAERAAYDDKQTVDDKPPVSVA
ncbi:hypothetical protein [Rhodopseudomonas palustris]|uniref:Cell wall surface anchor family protein n=1 Tax=Rhodopseudomonas palustris (strain BisB18) TaxID=316056 RepID=Q20Z89_RHOPB